MNQEEENAVISFLNGNDEIDKFLQSYHSSAEFSDLLEIINTIEQKSQEKIDQVISMSKNLKECFEDPLSQVNTSFDNFKNDFHSFQDTQRKFDESYKTIQSNLLKYIVIDRNIELASDIYKNLKIGLDEMIKFEGTFCATTIKQEELEEAVNYGLDKILVVYDYFQQTTNRDALTIFNSKIEEWESRIAHPFQIEVNSFDNFIIFFNKFDQEKYTNAKKIKEGILEQIYHREIGILHQFENDIKFLTDSKRKSEQFINEFFKSLLAVLSSSQEKFTQVPDSYSQGVTHIFKSIFSNIIKFIDDQLHSNNQLVFSFNGFYNIYDAQLKIIQNKTKKEKLDEAILEKANDIIHPIRERCCNELIKKWDKELKIMINDRFKDYKDHPNQIFTKTGEYIKSYKTQAKSKNNQNNNQDDKVSYSIYSQYQGKYIIKEVFEVIHTFETDYDKKISDLKEQTNPHYTELLIQTSNLIIQNINEITTINLDHTRSTILIILNSYDALKEIVSKFKSQRYKSETKLLPLLKLDRRQHSYLHAFASTNHFSLTNITQFFEHIDKYLITDSLKTRFTTLFTEHSIYLVSKLLILDNKDKTKAKLLSKISQYSHDHLTVFTGIEKLCNKALLFFEDPQNSTMNELINSLTSITIIKKLEPNLLQIINENK